MNNDLVDKNFPEKLINSKLFNQRAESEKIAKNMMLHETYGTSQTPVDSCISDRFDRGRVMIFIDGANLFYSALELGIEIDYTKLLQRLTVAGQLIHAFFYTGVDPANDKQHGFLLWMRRSGYRVVTKPLAQLPNGSKKANLDVEIAVDMMRLARHCDTTVLVSGDGDFAYVADTLAYEGVRVEVVGLRSMTSDSLIAASDCYVDLASIQQDIQKLNRSGYVYQPLPLYK